MGQSWRSKAVIYILVPFISERAFRKGGRGTNRESSDSAVSPEPHLRVSVWNLDGKIAGIVIPDTVHHEKRSGQRVFRPTAVCRRTKARIAPRAGPDRR